MSAGAEWSALLALVSSKISCWNESSEGAALELEEVVPEEVVPEEVVPEEVAVDKVVGTHVGEKDEDEDDDDDEDDAVVAGSVASVVGVVGVSGKGVEEVSGTAEEVAGALTVLPLPSTTTVVGGNVLMVVVS